MKLGEALNHRKYLFGLIAQLTAKLAASVTVVQGAVVQPSDDKAEDLKFALDSTLSEHSALVVSINETNNVTALSEGGLTIMQAIAHRDFLKVAIAQYQTVFKSIRPRVERSLYTQQPEPTVFVVADGIDAVAIKAQLNQYQAEYRRLDTQLQAANWTVDLIGS